MESVWVSEAEKQKCARKDLSARVKKGATIFCGRMNAEMAAREAGGGSTAYMTRTYKDGTSLSRRGRPAANNKAVVMAAVATFSRSEQTNGIQYKPKELGGMVQALLGKETVEEAADVAHTTDSLAVMRRNAC